MGLESIPNYKWIYTFDYAPEGIWESWRDSVYKSEDYDSNGIPLWIRKEVESVLLRLKPDLPVRILLSDSHFAFNGTWDDTLSCVKMLANELALLQHCDRYNSPGPFEGFLHLGDLTDGWFSEEKTLSMMERVTTDMKNIHPALYIAPGNHDYNYFRKNPYLIYPERPQYYVDVPSENLRMIFIDSFDPKEKVIYGFSDYCIHWLDSTLQRMPDGYKAIIFSHLPPLIRLQVWTRNIRGREKLISVLNLHAERILAYLNGHSHCDLLFNDLYNGKFPVVTINCAKCEYFTDHKPEGADVPFRKLGDCSQESFDLLQIDVSKGEMYFTRFGAGKDRMVKDSKAYFID